MRSLDELQKNHPDKIRGWYKDSDGYWIDLKPGWQTCPYSESHSVHERTVKELLASFKHVCKCDCESCRR